MTLATILLGILSFVMAVIWRKRLMSREEITIYLEARFGSEKVDTSGKTHYSNCLSYQWVMRNVIQNKLGKGGEIIRTALVERTTEGALALAILGTMVSFMAAYLVFFSFTLVGGSVVILLLAILLIQAPFDVAASDGLLKWLLKQDPADLKVDDFAYAKVSFGAISRWVRVLLAIGTAAIVIAPWSDLLLEGATYAITMLFTFILATVYTPLGEINPALAYGLFVVTVVLIVVLIFLIPGRVYGLIQKDIDIFSSEPEASPDDIDDETVEKEKDRGDHEVKT
ncbi:MAG: hypothetical protein ACFFAD_06505 [Candidatus Hermodarchaeota archaeon]